MLNLQALLAALAAIFAAAFVAWIASCSKRDVSIVDSFWSLFLLLAALVYTATTPVPGPRAAPIVVLVAIWAVRLSAYIAWRNHGAPEDRRYQEIRRRNEPHFALKSVYLVFGLQAALAWIISLPLFAIIASPAPLGALDYVGAALFLLGVTFEAVADWQLVRFKLNPGNAHRVMDRGLWRYSRHPNYFGEFCVWWGVYLIAVASGSWWALVSPLLMTALLLRVSGVVLLEKDIGERRPAYARYRASTNAFFPGPPRKAA